MRVADGVVVVEVGVRWDEDMVESCAEEARGFEVEEFGELV